jgi:hypothetical protein
MVEELGPRWFPLRDKIERWTRECGSDAFEPIEAKDLVKSWDFRSMPGIYLRLAQKATTSNEAIRDAAQKSLHDGFTSCLLLVPNPNPLAGPKCETTHECPRGQLCNDYKHCSEYSQPYNLRLAYRTMHVMTDEWVTDVQDITNKLTIRGAVASFEMINKYDLPVAADLLQRAKYFLVVVDEEPTAEEAARGPTDAEEDAGVKEDRSISSAPHQARVCAWRLEDDRKMVALRAAADGELRHVRRSASPPAPRTLHAQQQQANSCALALDVRASIGAEPTEVAPEDDGGAGDDGADGGTKGGGGS